MAQRVKRRSEISLDGADGTDKRYRLSGDGRVRQSLVSQYPQKRIQGDFDEDSNPRTSIITWDDWTGGVGLYSTDGRKGLTQFADSQLETRFKGHLTLPKDRVEAANPSVAGSGDEINELAGVLYVALNGGTDAYSYSVSGNSWSSKLHDFPAQVTDSLNFTLAGTEYVAFAHTGGYTYTSDGSSWTDDTTDTLHLAYWDDRLWGIDNTGQLWFSVVIGTEVNDAQLALPAGYVNGLFTGPDAGGEDILYAATEVGLYAHDAANSRFVRTNVRWPQNATAGKAAGTWNGEIYVSPGGMSVYRYNPVTGQVSSIGLDRGAGLDSRDRGDIERLIPAHTGMLAVVVDATDDTIWEYQGNAWHWVMMQATADIQAAHVSDANASYRVYWYSGGRLRYRALDTGFVNPDQDTIAYDETVSTWFHTTPWFNAGQNDVDKTAVRLRVDCANMSSGESAQIQFGLDYSSTFDADLIGSITANGVTIRTFPTLANNNREAGETFRAIRFRIRLNNDAINDTPNIKSLSLEWRRKLKARYGFTFDIDRTKRYGNRSPKKMKTDLVTAFEKSAMVELVYVDDDGDTQNYFVDIISMEDQEETGHGEKGVTRITAVES